MVGHRPLKPFILVRIQVPEPHKNPRSLEGFYFLASPWAIACEAFFVAFALAFS